MKQKLLTLALVAVAISGCAVRTSSGTFYFPQRGVVVQITHDCTDGALVYQAGRGLVAKIVGVTPIDVALHPPVFGAREVQVTVQSLDSTSKVTGSYTERFYIDQRSTTTQTWTISSSYSGGGANRRSQCPR